MALNFPTNPSVNDTYEEDSKSWIFNGKAWVFNPAIGATGPAGPAGEAGQGIRIAGTVATSADLEFPYSGSSGDMFIAQDTGNGHVWNELIQLSDDLFSGNTWTDIGPIRGPAGPAGDSWNNKPSEMSTVLASDGSGDGVTDLMTLMGTGSSSTNNESNNFTATLTQDIFSIKIIGIQSGINGGDYIGSSGLIEVTQDSTGGHVISPQHPLNIVMSGDPVNMSLITPETGVGTIGWYKYGPDSAALYLYFSDIT